MVVGGAGPSGRPWALPAFTFSSHPIRRKIRFQLVCSVLRASPAALRGHNGVLDSVGICRGRRSSAVRSVVLLAHCRPASPSEWPGLCARQSESRTRFRGHPSRLKPYGRTRIRWYEHLNSLTRAHNHPWQTRHLPPSLCAPPSDYCARSLLASCRRAWRHSEDGCFASRRYRSSPNSFTRAAGMASGSGPSAGCC